MPVHEPGGGVEVARQLYGITGHVLNSATLSSSFLPSREDVTLTGVRQKALREVRGENRMSSPSPAGRGGQGVRTQGGQGGRSKRRGGQGVRTQDESPLSRRERGTGGEDSRCGPTG